MSDQSHKDYIVNNLDKQDIEVYTQKGKDPQYRSPKITVSSGGGKKELVDFRGIPNLYLIIESDLVSSRNSKGSDGLKLKLSEKLNPKHIEVRAISDNRIQTEVFFEKAIQKDGSAVKENTDADVEVHHPDGFV